MKSTNLIDGQQQPQTSSIMCSRAPVLFILFLFIFLSLNLLPELSMIFSSVAANYKSADRSAAAASSTNLLSPRTFVTAPFEQNVKEFIETGKQCYLSRWGKRRSNCNPSSNLHHPQEEEPAACCSNYVNNQLDNNITKDIRTNPKTGSEVLAFLSPDENCLKIEMTKSRKGSVAEKWTRDGDSAAETEEFARELGVDAGWSEGLVLLRKNTTTTTTTGRLHVNSTTAQASSVVVGMKRFFLWKEAVDSKSINPRQNFKFSACICDSNFFSSPETQYSFIEILVFELYKGNDAIVETAEGLNVQYFTTRFSERTALVLNPPPPNVNTFSNGQISRSPNISTFADWKVTAQDYETNYARHPRFAGYWLRHKGDRTHGDKYSDTHDLLGRMDFRVQLQFENSSLSARAMVRNKKNNHNKKNNKLSSSDVFDCAQRAAPADCPQNDCYMSALKNKFVVFVGDSHLRTFYYGLLERLGIRFAANRVWRGGHDAKLPAQNTNLKFVSSSFLKTEVMQSTVDDLVVRQQQSKETSRQLSQQQVVFIAGLGQHHSTHCVSLRKHSDAVASALDFLDRTQQNKTLSEVHGLDFRPIWFGIPAQRINRHLFAPKPIGQARKDCRSNARHLLYSAIQQTLARQRSIPFLDTFAFTAAISYTSIDGSHFYSYGRDVLLDSLAEALHNM